MKQRILTSSVVTTLMMIAPVMVAKPASAHAPCGTAGTNLDHGPLQAPNHTGVQIRTGSSTGCTSRGDIIIGDRLNFFCFTFANDGFTWTYLLNDTTGVRGWSRDDLLPGNGSNSYCGF